MSSRPSFARTTEYSRSARAATSRFAGSVHGVVVQTRSSRCSPAGPSSGKRTVRGVGGLMVPLRDFVRGERGLAARAVREHIVPLLEEPPVEQRLQGPPDALDVRRVHCAVRVVVIEPVAEPAAHLLPDRSDLERSGPALLAKPLDPERFDLLLRLEPVPLLDLELHRKTVAVPAGHRAHEAHPAHPAVPQLDVLEDAGHQVAEVRRPVRRRGALGKTEHRSARAPLEDRPRYPGRFPVGEDSGLDCERRGDVGGFLAGRHGRARRGRER